MKFMLLVKANDQSESGAPPSKEIVGKMMKFNEEMATAGILLGLDGLHPSSKGARVTFVKGIPLVTDGPFTETKELIAGYWIIRVDSLEEAIAWAKKCPAPFDPEIESTIEVRQVFDMADFPAEVVDQSAVDRVSAAIGDR